MKMFCILQRGETTMKIFSKHILLLTTIIFLISNVSAATRFYDMRDPTLRTTKSLKHGSEKQSKGDLAEPIGVGCESTWDVFVFQELRPNTQYTIPFIGLKENGEELEDCFLISSKTIVGGTEEDFLVPPTVDGHWVKMTTGGKRGLSASFNVINKASTPVTAYIGRMRTMAKPIMQRSKSSTDANVLASFISNSCNKAGVSIKELVASIQQMNNSNTDEVDMDIVSESDN